MVENICYTLYEKLYKSTDKGKLRVIVGRKATVPLMKREAALPKSYKP